MPALSFLANFLFSLKIETKVSQGLQDPVDIAFESVIKYLFKRYLFDKIPLKEVFISDKSPFSVGSDSIFVKLPGDKVNSFKYGAK